MIKKLLLLLFLIHSSLLFSQGADCANASPISIDGPCLSGIISDNTADLPALTTCTSGTVRRDAWYSFTVTGGPLTISITGITADRNQFLQLISSTSNCGGLTQIACANTVNNNSNQTESIIATLANGNYYIKISNIGSNGDMNLTSLCVKSFNSTCTSATTLPCSTTNLAGTTVGTTNIVNGTGCSMGDYGVWYKFTGDGFPTTISSTATFDHEMAIMSGTCGALTNISCNDSAFSGGTESYTFTTTIGVNYFVYISHYANGNTTTGTFTISRSCVTCIAPTTNAASNITLSTATISWNATTPAPAIGYEYVYSTSPTTPTGSGTATTATSVNLTGLTANTTYYVFVRSNCGGNGYSAWSSSVLFSTCPIPITLPCSTTNLAGTTIGSNNTVNGTGCSMGNYGAWYSFTGDGYPTTISSTANFDHEMAIMSGVCGALTNISCNDSAVSGGTESYTFTTTIGVNYFVYISHWLSGNTTTGTFTISRSCLTCIVPTVNTVTNITLTTATISWNPTTPAPSNGYQYIVSTSPTTPTGAGTATTATSINLTGLTANTTYYVFVRSNCGINGFSTWSSSVSFTTGYCPSTSTSSTYYIRNFTTSGGILNIANNNSGYSAGGYGNFTAQTVSQVNSGNVTFNATFFNGNHTYGFNIWVDWNNDLDFDDPGELVYASGAFVASATGTFNVPTGASLGNHRMRIRANYLSTNPTACGSIGSGETEDYTFNVSNPLPCSGNPSNIFVNITSQTTVNVTWNPGSPVPANGYQYYFSPSNTSPVAATAPSGSTAAGVTNVNLSGLTAATTYFIWIRSNCGGGLGLGVWVGPISFYMPNCAIGPGTGTTTLACPAVVAGGLGLNGADPIPVDCNSVSGCVDLEATYLPIGQTTSYNVQSIPYAPPYQFNCLKNPVSVNVDDVWSPRVNLPFNFCYYGNNYNQCIISSNGAITFDLTNNTPGGYSNWSFANNIPSTTLFLNTIFGVYHDIDPSLGGTVGWELITLNTGCRALVAAWNNIPMYSCTTSLYTGMIVLYENTNIIEVYIKEKNACSSWNAGNALVGIQNANGTQAVVAPNRNSLSPDWTTTNEAWRFTPSGASLTTVTWHQGSGTAGPVVGTGDIITVCPSATTVYTANVTYALCTGLTLSETKETTVTIITDKTWNGTVSTNWNVANNWTPPNVPISSNCVIIPVTANSPIISGTNYNAFAKNILIHNGATLTVNPTNTITVLRSVNIQPTGTFKLENSASLIQTTSGNINSGEITIDRTTFVKNIDYVYWSSPVANFNSAAISPSSYSGHIFKWNTTLANSNGGQGNWVSGIETMVPGKGYIVRAPVSFPATPTSFTATFKGLPNNGTITTPISRGTHIGADYPGTNGTNITNLDDNWNLVGNPFPSAINANSFISNNTNIDGNIRLWTHGNAPSNVNGNPFYGDFVYNYSLNDYIVYNSLGSNPPGFNGYIGAGQGFFVTMIDGTAATQNIFFSNSLRSNTYPNNQFYRITNPETISTSSEANRIWLGLVNSNNNAATTLIGYIEGATLEKDRLFDAHYTINNTFGIYSLIDSKEMNIQGRPMPFNDNDLVPIGITIPTNGSYTIAINQVDGLFEDENQYIFLEDKLNNIIHDLRVAPYSFTTNAGKHDNRFVLRYTNSVLGINDNDFEQTNVYIHNQTLQIHSLVNIKQIEIFDVAGKLIYTYNLQEPKNHFEDSFVFAKGVYIANIKLENDFIISKKLMN